MEVFGYTRISVDLDEDSRENTSIENQKKIITDFVGSTFPDAHLTLFEDRDRSGYTFSQRESYQKMRSRMMSGECTILVVKDFSRFSRRNSLGLLELETLRDAGIRIISIGDGIDYPTKDDWMLIQFKFLMNEMPVTDTSRKIKQIIQSRQKDGKWVCAVPYGYRIINTKAMTYEIDPPAAEVVREIFRLYNNGWGYKKIANYLTDNGFPTPRANEISQKEAAGIPTKIRSSTVWNTATLSGLLANDFYIGTLRQKKYVRKGINGKDQKVGDEEHIVIENAHCPIIDPRTFAYTQEQMKLRTKNNYRGEKKYATDYSGFLFCGDCGSPMFSLSRPDIPAAYTCGTYHRRGLKGCTSHHIRVDTLDDLLKRYLKQVRDNSSAMLEELETAIREQPQREEEIGKTIDSIQVQLAQAKEQLKNTLKRKLLDTMGKAPETAAIIEDTYTEIEDELTQRIAGLEKQIDAGNTLRNNMLKVNRSAKTVIDVFNDILSKPTLDKRDISFLVERISVYTDHLDVKLKPDIDTLLNLTPDHEDSINFSTDSKDIASTTIVQRSTHQKDKVFTVNVVNEGDPLEIYTEKDGGVIFRKYSPMGDLQEFAAQMCESIGSATGHIAAVADRDSIIALHGIPKRELLDKPNSPELEKLMEQRKNYLYKTGDTPIFAAEGEEKYQLGAAAPILSQGDLMGCVMLLLGEGDGPLQETDQGLAKTAAGFLGKQMES